MSVQFTTSQPNKLLKDFKKKIDEGEVDTWSYDSAGDFTHTPSQWKHKAWLRPVVESDRLRLNIIRNTGYDFTRVIYSVYHGRFIEPMLTHCHDLFSIARATAKPTSNDADPVD
jgi:hypothetical protein